MSRRFDSEEYLANAAKGIWPDIHAPLTALVEKHVKPGASALDICCSTGVMGWQLRDRLGLRVVGIEGDAKTLALGRAGGVTHPVENFYIEPATLERVLAIIQANGVTVLVARRCLSEIFATRKEWGPVFAKAIYDAGVRQVFLQGRVMSSRSTHPLPSTASEVALLEPVFGLEELTPPKGTECAYLTAF